MRSRFRSFSGWQHSIPRSSRTKSSLEALRGGLVGSISYPFEKFERQVVELDHLLKPHGLLVLHYTQYSLMDTSVASRYEALGDVAQDDYSWPTFDRNSELVPNPVPHKSIYVKLRGSAGV